MNRPDRPCRMGPPREDQGSSYEAVRERCSGFEFLASEQCCWITCCVLSSWWESDLRPIDVASVDAGGRYERGRFQGDSESDEYAWEYVCGGFYGGCLCGSKKDRRFALSRIARSRGESCSAEGAPADERGSESSSDRVGGGGWASPGRTHCATSKSPHIPRTHRRRPRPASSARDWDWGTLERRSSDLHPASGKPQSVINPTVSTSIGCSGLDFPLDSSPRHRCHAVCCCCFLCLLV